MFVQASLEGPLCVSIVVWLLSQLPNKVEHHWLSSREYYEKREPLAIDLEAKASESGDLGFPPGLGQKAFPTSPRGKLWSQAFLFRATAEAAE